MPDASGVPTRVRLRILGSREVYNADGTPVSAVVAQPKRFALLVYLALNGPFAARSRDELLAMFWPELPDERARNALTQALSFLRRALGADIISNVGPQVVRLNADRLSCDAVEVERALAREDSVAVIQGYTDRLLPGFHISAAPEFDQWLESRRASLHSAIVTSASTLARRAYDTGDLGTAIGYADRALQLDPLSDRSAQLLLTLHAERGDRAAALRTFEQHAAALRAELDVGPSAAVLQLVAAMSNGGPNRADEATSSPAPSVSIHVTPVVSRAATSRTVVAATAPLRTVATSRRSGAWAVWLGTAALLMASVSRIAPSSQDAGRPAQAQLDIVLDDSVRVRTDLSLPLLSIDPMGRRIAFIGGEQTERIYLRSLDDPTPRAVPGTERARYPQFSPDGEHLTFRRDGGARIVPLRGGTVRTLIAPTGRFTLGDDASVVFEMPGSEGKERGLYRASAPGAAPQALTHLDRSRHELKHAWPHLLPGSRVALFNIATGASDLPELAAVRVGDGRTIRLGVMGHHPRFVAPGFIVYSRREGVLMGVRFDTASLRVVGTPVQVLDGVKVFAAGAAQADIARNGTLVFLRTSKARRVNLYDPVTQSTRALTGFAAYSDPRLSPDGKRLAVVVGDGIATDIGVITLASGQLTRLTGGGQNDSPEWTQDGKRVLWRAQAEAQTEMWIRSADESDEAVRLIPNASRAWLAADSTIVAHVDSRSFQPSRIKVLRRWGRDSLRTVVEFEGREPAMSPDGRLVAVVVDSGIDVRSVGSPWRRLRIASSGSSNPVWGRDGRVFFRRDGAVMDVRVRWSTAPTVTGAHTLATTLFSQVGDAARLYGATGEGTWLLTLEQAGAAHQPKVVFDWSQTLHERLPQTVAASRRPVGREAHRVLLR